MLAVRLSVAICDGLYFSGMGRNDAWVADSEESALQDRYCTGQAVGSVKVARSLTALLTAAADWSVSRSTTMPAWLPGR